jgi:aspartyl-tRNA(Asn)/glutamyl-tRNA(Gln) amidotransferase subunit A
LHFKFRENEARFEQADHGYQDPLEIFDVRWNAGVNASRGSGEKLREPTISGLTEFADEDAEYSALGYLEALGLLNELAIHMGRFHAEYDLLLTPAVPISAFEAGCEVPVGSPHRRWTSWTPITYPFVEVPMDVGRD